MAFPAGCTAAKDSLGKDLKHTAKESCNCTFDDNDVYKATLYTCIYSVALLLSLLEKAEVS